ncbi:MAG: quinone-dependent dihydroorotate dehydrogenase [Alphaproteobacteria bacterium]|nr:quinone-dependent dihydroorotate dehydrogenase [Alphaproteobacteria bacterium]
MYTLPFDTYPLLRPFAFLFDPEVAHNLAMGCLKKGLIPCPPKVDYPTLHTFFGGTELPHPIGLGAGFDKQAEIIPQLFDLGFSHVEIGGVTPKPQPGNPKPRMFRIAEAGALINRFNLNSIGFDAFLRRLEAWYDLTPREKRGMVGVNIARGDNCLDDVEAFIWGIKKFSPYVRFVTLNISCPNEACARQLEAEDKLKELLERVKNTIETLEKKPLLIVKISPDQTEEQAQAIARAALTFSIDGMIVSNTTATRPPSVKSSPLAHQRGGLSGKPLFEMSTKLLGYMYQATGGKIPLIGSGGVFTGEDAYAKIRKGASIVQVYTAFVFRGPFVAAHICKELDACLRRDGFSSVVDAVGADFKK